MSRLVEWFCARLCATDIQILWPVCLEGAQSVDDAIIVFMYHIEHDWAWRRIGSAKRAELLQRLQEPRP